MQSKLAGVCVHRWISEENVYLVLVETERSPVVTPADVHIERDYFVYKSLCNLKVYISLCFQSCACVFS